MDDVFIGPVLFWPSLAVAAVGVALIAWEVRLAYRTRQQHRNHWTTEE